MSGLFNWGNNPGLSSTMDNSQSIVPGMQWNNQAPAMSNGMGGDSGGGGGFNWFDTVDADGMKTQGMAGLGLGAAQGLFQGWLGMQQLDLAKKRLGENKRQFNMNWDAQKKTTNNQIYNAQVVRNGSADPSKNQDMGAYMNKWGIE